MAHIALELSLDEITGVLRQLPARDLVTDPDAVAEQGETASMMLLAETGFAEWEHPDAWIGGARASISQPVRGGGVRSIRRRDFSRRPPSPVGWLCHRHRR